MTLHTVVQRACDAPGVPGDSDIGTWATAAFRAAGSSRRDMELTVRVVDEKEAEELNRVYRGKDYVPNVLSFPMNAGDPIGKSILGDIVICPAVVAREANEQNKALQAHWCHMVVHGVLHCHGFEHDSETGAEAMEPLETRILAEFGFPDPYTWQDEQ